MTVDAALLAGALAEGEAEVALATRVEAEDAELAATEEPAATEVAATDVAAGAELPPGAGLVAGAPLPPDAVADTAPFTQDASDEFWIVMAEEY